MFRYGWLYSATAYNHAYHDSGLFCIHASAEPQYIRDMVKVIVSEIANMANNIQIEELAVCIHFIINVQLLLQYLFYRDQRNNCSHYY